jgi:hypothetical protein
VPFRWMPALALAAALACSLSACQMKQATVPPNFITTDSSFVLQSVQRYDEGQTSGTDTMLVTVKALYTNPDSQNELITSDRFQLIDPILEAVYYGINGGGIDVPSMPQIALPPGKQTTIEVAFRVPAALTTARLVYRP